MKIVIIGNSGSGKTWLAGKLAAADGIKTLSLDDLFWEPGGFDRKRPLEVVLALIREAKQNESWVAEGVFGELAQMFLDEADMLIWLDIDWETCKGRLSKRGSESKKHMDREQSESGLKELMDWASKYNERTNMNSWRGHQQLFLDFEGQKTWVRSEDEVNAIAKAGVGS